jgi:hypothetical protein
MPVSLISVIERLNGPGGANAAVSFDRGPEYPITIIDPFDEVQEQRLEWYFEERLHFPFVNHVKAREAADSIKTYGVRVKGARVTG